MIYAYVNNVKTHINDVAKGTIAKDILTGYDVKACKGHYRQYWKYKDNSVSLPPGYENETEWHNAWKRCLKEEYVEVICGNNNEHRAAIKTDKYVIEPMLGQADYDVIKERIDFYNELTQRRVIFIVNAYKSALKHRIDFNTKTKDGKYSIVNWKHKRKWAFDVSAYKNTNVFLDISKDKDFILRVWKYDNILYGERTTKTDFYNIYLKNYCKNQGTVDEFLNGFKGLNYSDYNK